MSYIYVILSASPTKIGLMIRKFTDSTFSHASISLTKDLSEMYSFARYRASNPLVGGFIKEFPQRLTMMKNDAVMINVYQIPVTNEEYENIKAFVYNVRDDKEKYIYNSLALIGRPFGKGNDVYKSYVCTSFVTKALLNGGINFGDTILTPKEIELLLNKYLYYSGNLIDYGPAPEKTELVEDFFIKYSKGTEFLQVIKHFRSLAKRTSKAVMHNK